MMAGNWKMNKTIAEATELAQSIQEQIEAHTNVDRVLCPPFVSLPAVSAILAGSTLATGAQNVHWAESGAYTGEVSAPMLADLVTYVIIGHSERRQYFAETDETVNQKVHAALSHDLIPIICVGESLEQNEAGETNAIVGQQVRAALLDVAADRVRDLVIAYEPIWAIGTGKAATAGQANETCGGVVRQMLADLYGADVAQEVQILYGGSTNDGNIAEFMQESDIDGALIGGASLKVDSYSAMVRITSEMYA
jgi:triosephosphate isomerase